MAMGVAVRLLSLRVCAAFVPTVTSPNSTLSGETCSSLLSVISGPWPQLQPAETSAATMRNHRIRVDWDMGAQLRKELNGWDDQVSCRLHPPDLHAPSIAQPMTGRHQGEYP